MKNCILLLLALFCVGCVCKERPNLRIAVISDNQAAPSKQHWGIVNTEKAFRFLAPFKPDAVVMAGDLADRYFPEVFDLYMESFRRNFKEKLPANIVCAGNHDFWSGREDDYDEIWHEFADRLNISRENPCRQTVGGYDFITLTQERVDEYTPDMLAKLKKLLDEAVARDNIKPIFVVTHFPPYNTMARSEPYVGRSSFRNLLNNYPQVISLSGHTHVPLDWERAFWQGEFTAVTTSTLSYGCIGGENFMNVAGGSILPFGREVQQAMIIDVFDDRMEIHRYNVRDKREIKPDLLWTVDIPYKPSAENLMTRRQASAVAPEFPSDAELAIRHDFGFAYLLFPPAQHPNMVFCYVLRASEKTADGKWTLLTEVKYVADFYRYIDQRTKEVSLKIPENVLTRGRKVKFEVFPMEDFGKCGKPLSLEIVSPWNITKPAALAYPIE